MKDKLGDLIPWVQKLEVTLVKTDLNDDRGEVERRAQLARFASPLSLLVLATLICYNRDLEDIGKRSLALSEKGKVARALDKTRDSAEVINLVERLRQAILVYQVSTKLFQRRKSFTRSTGVTTTVDIRPDHPIGREFLPFVFAPGTKLFSGCLGDSSHHLMRF